MADTGDVQFPSQLNKMKFVAFIAAMLSSTLFSVPAETVDSFAKQLADVTSAELDSLAPLKTVTRKALINRFLSPDAKDAKRTRRRLERHWKHAADEQDRRAYPAKADMQIVS